MKKKQINEINILILLLLFPFFSTLGFSKEFERPTDQEKVFYAISSLSYHVNKLASDIFSTNESIEEKIEFNEEDVACLWETATNHCYFYSAILEAQQTYYQAKEYPLIAVELYEKVGNVLEGLREKLNQNLFQTYSKRAKEKETLFPLINKVAAYPSLDDNPFVDAAMRKQIEPHLIPLDHPLKAALDSIFSVPKILASEKSLKQAGFNILFDDLCSYVIITKHPELPGYLEKIYIDTEKRKKGDRPGWLSLTYRCMGAANVRNLIQAKKIKHFTVPDKWVYLLPIHGDSPANKPIQPVILLVTDMNLTSKEETEKAWANATTEILDELYCIISHGYASSSLVKNVPYTKSGKFAFVDTERPNKNPKYDKARRYISKKMQPYWDKLVKTGGQPNKK